jgi:small subunit ribosomal protein S20
MKNARLALEGEEYAISEEAVRKAVSELDRAATKGVIHKKNAARNKSRLMTRLASIQAEEKETA